MRQPHKRPIRLSRLFLVIVILYTVAMLGMLSAVSQIYYMRYAQDNSAQMLHAVQENTARVVASLKESIENVQLFAYSQSTIQYLKETPAGKLRTNRAIVATLNSIAGISPFVSKIYLYSKDGQTLSSADKSYWGSEEYYTYLQIVDGHIPVPPRQSSIFTRSYQSPTNGNRFIAFLVPIYDIVGADAQSRYLGSVIALCGANFIYDMLLPGVGSFYALEEDGVIIYPVQLPMPAESILSLTCEPDVVTTKKLDDTRYYAVRHPVGDIGWNLVGYLSEEDMLSSFTASFGYTLIIAISLIAVHGMVWVLLYRFLARPMITMAHQVREIGIKTRDKLTIKPKYHEIADLTHYINDTLERIHQMNESILQERERAHRYQTWQLKAQILFLQAQINPHFLYNALGEIQGMAATGHVEAIRTVTSKLSRIYRYCATSDLMTTLEQELSIVTEYGALMGASHPGRYTLHIEVVDEALPLQIPKMVLQPLVENAFIHGLSATHCGHVIISGQLHDGQLEISISDNGGGIDPDKMASINEQLSTWGKDAIYYGHPHIGMINVHQRIRLICGDEYSMRLEANQPSGLTVRIQLQVVPAYPFEKTDQPWL